MTYSKTSKGDIVGRPFPTAEQTRIVRLLRRAFAEGNLTAEDARAALDAAPWLPGTVDDGAPMLRAMALLSLRGYLLHHGRATAARAIDLAVQTEGVPHGG